MGFLKKTIKGITWSTLLKVFTKLITFAKTIIIARILLPAQIGIFGIITTVITLFEVFTEIGINIFIVQQRFLSPLLLNSSWVISMTRGFFIALLMFCLRFPIASFFNLPEISNLIMLVILIPIIKGFVNPAVLEFQKKINFKKEFFFKISVCLSESLISTILVIFTKSVYGLILGMICGAITELILSFIFVNRRPKLEFSINQIKNIANKCKWITLSGIFNYFFIQGDSIIVGKLLGASSLGIYQMAYKIAILPISEISDVVTKVTFPVYVKIRSNKLRLRRAFLKTLATTLSLVVLPSAILFFLNKQIVFFLIGSKWAATAEILKVLVFYAPLRVIINLSVFFFYSINKPKYVTLLTFLNLFFFVILIFPLISKFTLFGAGLAMVTSMTLTIILVYIFLKKELKKNV